MPRLPVVQALDAIRAFDRAGFTLQRWHGSHAILQDATGRHLSVPVHLRDLSVGTLRALIRQAGLSVDEFINLLR